MHPAVSGDDMGRRCRRSWRGAQGALHHDPLRKEQAPARRKGDVLMITRVDRLARSIGDLQDIVRAVRAEGASLKATEQPIDTSTAAGKCFLGTALRYPHQRSYRIADRRRLKQALQILQHGRIGLCE
jgi:DNA invertase Pin-like site-specific DNA recombinase